MKITLPERRVNRADVPCSHCGTIIPKGARISFLFNYCACKSRECEESITERYHQAKLNAKMARSR